MNTNNGSAYKIPLQPQYQHEPEYIYYTPPKPIKAEPAPVKRHQNSRIPQVASVDIYGEILAKSDEIIRLRARAEEELRLSRSIKNPLRRRNITAVNGPLHYKNLLFLHKKQRRNLSRELLDLESRVGATVFGQIPSCIRREFFMVDRDSWIWHEEWTDGKRKLHQNTIRYEVKADSVIKIQSGPRYFNLKGRELDNFRRATEAYHHQVLRFVYGI